MRWRVRITVALGAGAVALAAALPATVSAAPRADDDARGADAGGRQIERVKHIVVMMQENRSYDEYFGQLHFEGQPASAPEPRRGNPDPTNPSGPRIRPFHQTAYCEVTDLDHSWNGTHLEWAQGRMDGFTAANVDPLDPTGSRTMGFYDQADLPFYYGLANTFGIGDRYFASALTQTFPNRFFLLAGTAFGHIRNDFPSGGGFTQKTIFELMDQASPPVTWKVYFAQFPFAGLFAYVQSHSAGHLVPISQYFTDAAAGTLPDVSFIDPIFLGKVNVENDEHPPANVQVGEKFSADVINALVQSPNWTSSALFLTYDEHGGFYDHVPPPRAAVPDSIPPMLLPGDTPGAFDRYGIRVPAIVVSPFARGHFVSHVVHDHTSILRFIEDRFRLPALTNRDARAHSMREFFDFANPPFMTPPVLPAAPIDPAHVQECNTLHP